MTAFTRYRNDPEGTRLPIKLDATTNGEFAPIPLAPVHHRARQLAFEAAAKNARRLALTRRAFLEGKIGQWDNLNSPDKIKRRINNQSVLGKTDRNGEIGDDGIFRVGFAGVAIQPGGKIDREIIHYGCGGDDENDQQHKSQIQ